MTKDEAIIQLHCIVVDAEWLSPHMVEAIDMAIEALERTSNAFLTHECVKPTHECVERVGNSDMMRPKGEWDYSDDMYETRVCSVCEFNTEDYKEYNYCPNCGAKMRGGDQ